MGSASSFERSFARQIGKIAALAERIALEAALEGADTVRAVSQLRKVESLLQEIARAESLGPKRQDRLADDLRERRHKLLEAFDSDPASAPAAGPRKSDRGDKGDKKRHRS